MINTYCEGCNIAMFYDGMKNIDPHLIKKQTYQQGEIYVFMKSVLLTKELVNCAISKLCHTECPSGDCSKLIVDSNQILTLGYKNIKSHSINISIAEDLTLSFINGSTGIIFNDNVLVNNGIFSVYHSNFCLESNNEAKFVNNGKVYFNNSQMFGTGMIINNSLFTISCYSKFYLGRLKDSVEKKITLSDSNNEIDESYIYDFGQNSTKFINAGCLIISGYSLFDLLGYFINSISDITECFTEISDCTSVVEYKKPKKNISKIFIRSNSRFLFTVGRNYSDSFINDSKGLIISENNTYIRFKTIDNCDSENLNKNLFTNKGNIIFNGETYFISICIENYKIIKNTVNTICNYVKNGLEFTKSFNYAKIVCVNNRENFIPTFKNIGNKSLLEISPTSTLHIFGYQFVNQGFIGIGISKNSISINDDTEDDNTIIDLELDEEEGIILDNENNIQLLKDIRDIKINGEFIFGFIETTSNINVMFKNWGNIYIFQKSRFILGFNSSCVINGKRQVILFNYGLIRNWGYLKVCRFSEIINLPSFPFNPDCKLYGIINGNKICTIINPDKENIICEECRYNAIIIVMRPIPNIQNNPFTGGFIKSENKIFSNCSVIRNLNSGVIISWYGYQEDLVTGDCIIIYGIKDDNLKKANNGKLIPLPYPNSLENWPQKCLSKFIEQQSFSFDFDFKIC